MPDKTASRFDSEAATWDSNPTTVRSSALFFDAIKARFPQLTRGAEKKKRALEIGCGTGLLSVHLAPLLDEYLCFDPSQGMIDVLESKIPSLPSGTHLRAFKELLTEPDSPSLGGKGVDYAFSHLTLHHIPDMQSSIDCLAATLNPGGYLIMSDFEHSPTSELFHPQHKHHDVERHRVVGDEIRGMMEKAGLKEVKVEHSFDLPKAVEGGSERDFAFLICMGQKQ